MSPHLPRVQGEACPSSAQCPPLISLVFREKRVPLLPSVQGDACPSSSRYPGRSVPSAVSFLWLIHSHIHVPPGFSPSLLPGNYGSVPRFCNCISSVMLYKWACRAWSLWGLTFLFLANFLQMRLGLCLHRCFVPFQSGVWCAGLFNHSPIKGYLICF